jgi:aminoglycoside phosphotransferase (APT) family kinase protein
MKLNTEFKALKLIGKYKIAPKGVLVDNSRKIFDSEFMIQEHIKGKTAEQLKIYKTKRGLKILAKLLSKIHSIPIKGNLKKLPKEKGNLDYNRMVKEIKSSYVDYIKTHVKNKRLIRLIDNTMKYLKNSRTKYAISEEVISQGDFCEQNIIINKNKSFLVDFESLGISNRFTELALVLVTFKGTPFNLKQRKIFLEEYKKQLKITDQDFDKKVKAWIPILQMTIFLWAIKHVLRTRNKEFHSHFLENNDFKEDLKYVDIVLKNCIRLGVVDKKYKNLALKRILI